MCGGRKPGFTCEHLPKKYVKTAEHFHIRTGKGTPMSWKNGEMLWDTFDVRLCENCSKILIETLELSEQDKNKYGEWVPGTQENYL